MAAEDLGDLQSEVLEVKRALRSGSPYLGLTGDALQRYFLQLNEKENLLHQKHLVSMQAASEPGTPLHAKAANGNGTSAIMSIAEPLDVGDRVRARNSADQPWRYGTLTSLSPIEVQVDGWPTPLAFHVVERGEAPVAISTGSPTAASGASRAPVSSAAPPAISAGSPTAASGATRAPVSSAAPPAISTVSPASASAAPQSRASPAAPPAVSPMTASAASVSLRASLAAQPVAKPASVPPGNHDQMLQNLKSRLPGVKDQVILDAMQKTDYHAGKAFKMLTQAPPPLSRGSSGTPIRSSERPAAGTGSSRP